jgi:mannose-6-phosphate isomerase-like protein (cupin superfamily)
MDPRRQRRVTRATSSGWDAVEAEGYRPGAAVGVERHTILGARKNDAAEPGPRMELRYFELQPGAVSRLEKHEHEHYVIVRRGDGYVIVGDTVSTVGPNDVVYVAPMELHQFLNRGNEPFGFYCIVDACRDFPQEPSADDLARLQSTPAGVVAKPFAVPLSSRTKTS